MRQVGFIARRVLTDGVRGRLAAAFERSLYVEFSDGWVCLTAPDGGPGPLNMHAAPWRGFAVGTPVSVTARRLDIGGAASIAIPDRVWRPPAFAISTRKMAASGLSAALSVCPGRVPAEGLGVFLTDEMPSSPEARAAVAPVRRLERWLRGAWTGPPGALEAPTDALAGLVGLGPGLTPSGDDFIGGVMLTAHAMRRPDIAACVYSSVDPGRTVPISAAHLAAAREGAANPAVHALVNAILGGDAAVMPERLSALDKIGHSSGWDAFAGIASALRASLQES